MAIARHVGCKNTDLAVGNFTRCTARASYSARGLALLKAGFIDHQHRVARPQDARQHSRTPGHAAHRHSAPVTAPKRLLPQVQDRPPLPRASIRVLRRCLAKQWSTNNPAWRAFSPAGRGADSARLDRTKDFQPFGTKRPQCGSRGISELLADFNGGGFVDTAGFSPRGCSLPT